MLGENKNTVQVQSLHSKRKIFSNTGHGYNTNWAFTKKTDLSYNIHAVRPISAGV